jgi:hypothetical protein
LAETERRAVVTCAYCGTDVRIPWTPVESAARTLEKRQNLEPQMEALMARYAERLGAGDPSAALPYYEAFTFLTVSLGYEVEDLAALEPMVAPLMQDAARQLGVAYQTPTQRGERVTFQTVARLTDAEG